MRVTVETYRSDTDEQIWLDFFWPHATDYPDLRLTLLRLMSHVELIRPSDWDYAEVRRQLEMMRPRNATDPRGSRMMLPANQPCWVCQSMEWRVYWHHVIWVQHGGSSHPRNLVPLCHAHHRAVHPWLPPGDTTETRSGPVLLGDWMKRNLGRVMANIARDTRVEVPVDDQPF